MTIRLTRLHAQDTPVWLGPALDVYVTAMNYPRGTEHHRAALWREHMARPGWSAFGALQQVSRSEAIRLRRSPRHIGPPLSAAGDEVLVGIGYGYRGAHDQWWNQQLRAGLRITGCDPRIIEQLTHDYFELTELHVHPSVQGHRIGEGLLARLLADRPERQVLLSTPEVAAEDNRAWSLYRRMGFGDVLRNFTFTGDPRPFAFLGRTLPLPNPAIVTPRRHTWQ